MYRIHVAAQVSGVSEPLIRAWERRYGILKPARTPGGYRTYGEADIEVLKRLKQLTSDGVSIAQAAKLLPALRREVKTGSAIKAPLEEQLQRWKEEILLAARQLDQHEVERVLDEALRSMRPARFFEGFVAPLMREVGDCWKRRTLSVAEEHLISYAVRAKLAQLVSGSPRHAKRHVLCACAPEDSHELGLLGAALRFRQAGWRVTLLGARTPVEQLAQAQRTLAPDLLAISVVSSTGAAEFLHQLARAMPDKKQIVLGGQAAVELVALAQKHSLRVVKSEADWRRLLGRTR